MVLEDDFTSGSSDPGGGSVCWKNIFLGHFSIRKILMLNIGSAHIGERKFHLKIVLVIQFNFTFPKQWFVIFCLAK